MPKKFIGIYIHHITGGTIFYVGKGSEQRSRNFTHRSKEHQNFVKNHGINNILITYEKCQSENQAFELEKFFIAYFKSCGYPLVNKSSGGQGFCGCKLSNNHKNIISKTQAGKFLSKITRKKISNSLKRYFKDPIHVEISRQRQKSRMRNMDLRLKISNTLTGRKLPLSQRKKMSRSRLKHLSNPANMEALKQSIAKTWKLRKLKKAQ